MSCGTAYKLDVAALYRRLDEQRAAAGLTWKTLAQETGLSPSTFTRLADGKAPDADGLCTLIIWLGLSLRQFTRATPDHH